MKLLLILLSVTIFKNSHAVEPTFTTRPCVVAEDRSNPVFNCAATTFTEGAHMNAMEQESEDLCAKAAQRLSDFHHSFGRNFGRYRFKMYTTEEDPVSYNVLRCEGSPRPFFLKKSGENHYEVIYQAVETPGLAFC